MRLTWIGQSGYVLKSQGTEIIIDPYLSDIVNKVANRPRLVEAPINPAEIKVDAVVCTHDHLDHLDPEAVAEMPKSTRFITTNEGKAHFAKLGIETAEVLNVGESVTVGSVKLIAVFAEHSCEAFGLIVEAEGKRFYFSSDTLFNEELFKIAEYKPDYTFICINGKLGNMNVEEAVITAKKIGAKVNVPTHYGMFASNTEDPKKFTDNIEGGLELQFNVEYDI